MGSNKKEVEAIHLSNLSFFLFSPFCGKMQVIFGILFYIALALVHCRPTSLSVVRQPRLSKRGNVQMKVFMDEWDEEEAERIMEERNGLEEDREECERLNEEKALSEACNRGIARTKGLVRHSSFYPRNLNHSSKRGIMNNLKWKTVWRNKWENEMKDVSSKPMKNFVFDLDEMETQKS
jgi:hypothetical protein